jgi:hypothetical protein
MVKHGKAPYMECSSMGRQKLSSFYARPKSLKGKSIEAAYQAMKVFEDGSTGLSWKEARGRLAVNQSICVRAYKRWWREWVDEQDLLRLLQKASGMSDCFGQEGHVCQATVLWEIRNESLQRKHCLRDPAPVGACVGVGQCNCECPACQCPVCDRRTACSCE